MARHLSVSYNHFKRYKTSLQTGVCRGVVFRTYQTSSQPFGVGIRTGLHDHEVIEIAEEPSAGYTESIKIESKHYVKT